MAQRKRLSELEKTHRVLNRQVHELRKGAPEKEAEAAAARDKLAKLDAARGSGEGGGAAAADWPMPPLEGDAPAPPPSSMSEEELQEHLSKVNNLLDTLPAGLALLRKQWSETRGEKTRGVNRRREV